MRARIENSLKTALGALRTTTAAVAAGSLKINGWARSSTGLMHIVTQGGTLVPVTAERREGLAFTAQGALYTTDTAHAATAQQIGGFRVRDDGALHVNTGATPAGDWIGGVRVLTGRLYIA